MRKGASFLHNNIDQAELDKSMKLLELVENDVSYVVASIYLPDSATTPVKGASNIGPRVRIARSINARNDEFYQAFPDPAFFSASVQFATATLKTGRSLGDRDATRLEL